MTQENNNLITTTQPPLHPDQLARTLVTTSLTSSSTYKVLHLPELVAHVFAFLSPYVVRQHASLVCREWHRFSRSFCPLPPLVASWHPLVSSDQCREFYTDILPNANVLCILVWKMTEDDERAWNQLLEGIQNMPKKTGSKRLTSLTMEVLPRLTSLLHCSATFANDLRELKIEKMSKAFQQPFEIDVILDNCPSLVELSFSGGTKAPSHQDMTTIDLSKDHRLWSHTTTNTTLKLQTLCIKGLILSPSLLKVLVGASPHLIKLQLSRIGLGSDPVQPFNSPFILERFPDDLMSLTAQSCPRLEYIQMGLSAIIMNEYELLNFRDSFKAVSHWGFNRSDLQQRSLSKFLLNNINLPIYLTGLEIHPDAAPAGIHMDLHTYLTSPYAGTLIHLRILGANYSLSHFESGFLSPDIAWTCSGLETLHLRAHSEYGNLTAEDSHKAGNQWLSRHVFLGLSKAFPKMKDLWINSPNIDFELEGGMCLLRRMVDLEKIRIQSMRGGLFKERDLAWLNSDPTPTQHARNNHILKEVQDQIRTFRGGSHNRLDMVHPKMVPGYKPRLRDQSIAGTLEQVADLLEEIQTPGVAKRSLPYLESLVIESGKRLSEFIQKEQETQAKKIIKRMHGTFLFKLKYNYIDN